jgi:hypothetical protein
VSATICAVTGASQHKSESMDYVQFSHIQATMYKNQRKTRSTQLSGYILAEVESLKTKSPAQASSKPPFVALSKQQEVEARP